MATQQFVSHSEACRVAGGAEVVRQAVLTGNLRGYIELMDVRGSWSRGFAGAHCEPPRSGRSLFASWIDLSSPIGPDLHGAEPAYELSGWFMIDPLEMQWLARRGEIRNWMVLTPALDDAAEASHDFSDDIGFVSDIRPHLEDIWFRAVDIERLASKEWTLSPDVGKPAKLRSDRETNLLRVIACLWKLSSLPPEHNTVADKISALIEVWGWDKPTAGTIADTILKEAANLSGAKIRN